MDNNLIEKLKRHTDIHSVFHFAALKSVPESEKNPDLYIKNNIEGTKQLLSLVQVHSIKRIIFSSSAAVYGDQDIQPTKETAVLSPKRIYAQTKKLSEELIEKQAQADQLKAISLRYFNPIGAHEDYVITDNFEGTDGNIMAMLIRVATGLEEKLNIFGDDYPTPDGTCIRDYIHVVDLAEAHVAALTRLVKGESTSDYEVFNLGTGKGSSVLEVIKSFEKVSGSQLPYRIAGRREGDVIQAFADTEKANSVLGWKSKYGLDDALASAWAWERKLRNLD